jgi:hypothetical protein
LEIDIHFYGGVQIVFHGAPMRPIMRTTKERRIFGLTYPQQQLAKLGRCPMCKAKALVEVMKSPGLCIVQCWACAKLLILPDDLMDPFMGQDHLTAPANDSSV